MKIFGKKQVDKSLNIVDQLVTDKDKKQELAAELVDNEMNSGDYFTRRARPSIVYFGLFVVFTELFGLRMWILTTMEASETVLKFSNSILEYFLFTWGGVVGIYAGGRSYEKIKMRRFKK